MTQQHASTVEQDRKTDPRSFEKIARTVFAPAYPVIAAQILKETGVTRGFCLDIGCGGGHLGMAVAKLGNFDMGFLDPSDGMRYIVAKNTAETGLSHRTQIFEGSAEAIPLADESVDLAISRGSVFFWTDRETAFQEVYRVLKPGGKAYIGGGFGSAAIREEINRKMAERNNGEDNWSQKVSGRLGPDAANRFEKELRMAGIFNFRIIQSPDRGLWMLISKEAKHDSL